MFFFLIKTILCLFFFFLFMSDSRADGEGYPSVPFSNNWGNQQQYADENRQYEGGYEDFSLGSKLSLNEEKKNPVEYEGICPVCLIDMGVFVSGNAEYQIQYQEKVYHFAAEKQYKIFQKNPKRYTSKEAHNAFLKYCREFMQKLKKTKGSSLSQ